MEENQKALGPGELTNKEKIEYLYEKIGELFDMVWELRNQMDKHKHLENGQSVMPLNHNDS